MGCQSDSLSRAVGLTENDHHPEKILLKVSSKSDKPSEKFTATSSSSLAEIKSPFEESSLRPNEIMNNDEVIDSDGSDQLQFKSGKESITSPICSKFYSLAVEQDKSATSEE